jgi:hypothetical protein
MFEDCCVFAEIAPETTEASSMSTRCTCPACSRRRMLWAYFTPADADFQSMAHSGVYRWTPNASCERHDASPRA